MTVAGSHGARSWPGTVGTRSAIADGLRDMQIRPMDLSPEERTLRMVVGWTLALPGLTLVATEASAALTIAGAATAFIGLAVFATGSCGRCPIYRRLGRVPRSLRRPRARPPRLAP